MYRMLLRRLLALVITRAAPLTYDEASMLIDAVDRLHRIGVWCDYGTETLRGKPACIPADWTTEHAAARRVTCGRCPVYQNRIGM